MTHVHHIDWRGLLELVPECSLLCVDAPYSEKTHRGHDAGAQTANKAGAWANRAERWAETAADDPKAPTKRRNRSNELKYAKSGKSDRSTLNYAFWTPEDVNAFVDAWEPRTRGWFCSMTDHVLAPVWDAALTRHRRLVFAPIACVDAGATVRMTGDGPAQWSCFLIVARRRTMAASKWRSLPGAYVVPSGMRDEKMVVGGKQIWLLEQIVRDYSNGGDLVVDPCVGGGTTGRAAVKLGRRFVGGDVDPAHVQLANDVIAAETRGMSLADLRSGQMSIFDFAHGEP